jgi:hypothetical protein
MREDYKLKGSITKMQVEVEKNVSEQIAAMERYTKLSASEIANTALKRFIAAHKDFLPPEPPKGSLQK